MAPLVTLLLAVIASAVLAASLLLALEIFAGVCEIVIRRRPGRQREALGGVPPGLVVLIPAHDEEAGISDTIRAIRPELPERGRIVVVADNCTDRTAEIALASGAEVISRSDPSRRGKGYALDFGVRALTGTRPDVVVVIDADCRVSPGTIQRLSATCASTGRPVQALDLMLAPVGSGPAARVAEFAWRVKNWLRPLGLLRLGWGAPLHGTGMAFPWGIISKAQLASGSIVEDILLALELNQSGVQVLFCPDAIVTSYFAKSTTGALSQRRRWELGHLETITRVLPRFLWKAITSRNWALFTAICDYAIPPLGLLCMGAGALLICSFICALFGGSAAPLILSAVTLLILTAAILSAWVIQGRDLIPLKAWPFIAVYLSQKLGVYKPIKSGGAAQTWVRSERDKSE